jgi:hypothetical protein
MSPAEARRLKDLLSRTRQSGATHDATARQTPLNPSTDAGSGCRMPRDTPPDDRHYCRSCRNLAATGLCLAARRGELQWTGPTYHPVDDIPRRCEAFVAS